jgi:hypothetical protein
MIEQQVLFAMRMRECGLLRLVEPLVERLDLAA